MVASGWKKNEKKTSIPNFSFLGSLGVAQIYLTGWLEKIGNVGETGNQGNKKINEENNLENR